MKLNVRQAAKLLSVSESEVYRWVESGEIPCVVVKNQPLFGRAELLEWATARRLPVSLELFENGDDGETHLRLADALERGGVHHDVPGRDRAAVLRAVVERLPLTEEDDRELLLQILLARESTGSSGIGEGIAIPHVRSPLIFPGTPGVATLSYLATPVPFDAIDGKPVDTVFTLVSPTIRGHLQLLARLSAVLLDRGFKEALQRRAASGAIVAEARRVEAALAQKHAQSAAPGRPATGSDAE
jgi:PTS system nitrogen regulatory IIA component